MTYWIEYFDWGISNTNDHNAFASTPFPWARHHHAAQDSTCPIYPQTSKWYIEARAAHPTHFQIHAHRTPSIKIQQPSAELSMPLRSLFHPPTEVSSSAGHIDRLGEAGKRGQDAEFGTPLALLDIEAQSAMSTAVLANSVAHALRGAVFVGHLTGLQAAS